MAQRIESGKLFVKEVFDQWYRIPEYQRPYVWGKDQITELIDDIAESHRFNNEAEYFLGSLVLQKRSKSDASSQYDEYDVLDGQQRLTTLFLLTAFVRDRTSKQDRKETCQRSIYRRANPDDNIPERVRINFEIRGKVQEFIDKYVKEENGTNKIEELKKLIAEEQDSNIKNMASAILYMDDYFADVEAIPYDDFFPYLRNRVLLIYVSTEGLEDAFRLFTVLNDRGLKLRNSDILKAENLREVRDDGKRTKYAKVWEEIEDSLGDDFDNFLSNIRTILVKEKARVNLLQEYEENIYNRKMFDREAKRYITKPPLLVKGEATFEYVRRMYSWFDKVINSNTYSIIGSFKLDNILNMMQKVLPADYWLAPVLSYFDKFQYEKIYEFLVKLDNKFSYDWIIGLTPTERIENMNSVLKVIESSESMSDLLHSNSLEIDWEELSNCINGPIYGKRFVRYILYKLDFILHGDTTPLNPPETVSVEHILPQNPSTTSQWCSDFTIADRVKYTNTIGNLVLISRRKNTSQGNLDYSEKKTRYFNGNIETFSNSIRVMSRYNRWTINEIEENQEFVLKKLKDHYNS